MTLLPTQKEYHNVKKIYAFILLALMVFLKDPVFSIPFDCGYHRMLHNLIFSYLELHNAASDIIPIVVLLVLN